MLYDLVMFDLIPTDFFESLVDENTESVEEFDAYGVLSDSTIEAGYESSNVVTSTIFTLLILACTLAICILVIILRLFCFKVDWVNKALKWLWRKIFWNFIIRTVLEMYLELSLKMGIKLYSLNYSNWFETTNSMTSVISLVLLCLFGLLTPVFLTCKKNQLNSDAFKQKYSSLTHEMRLNSLATRFYFMFFMMRRIALTALIIFLPSKPWAQI